MIRVSEMLEIVEVIVFETNVNSGIVNAIFRTSEDSEDDVREDFITITELDELNNTLISEIYDLFEIHSDDDEPEDNYTLDDVDVGIEDIIEILNNYYREYPDRLPKITQI